MKEFSFSISGEINDTMAREFSNSIADAKEGDKLFLHINSHGGRVEAAWGMYNQAHLTFGSHNIRTLAEGECSSAAILLFMLGNIRTGFQSTRFTFHEFSESLYNITRMALLDMAKVVKKDQKIYEETIAARMCSANGLGESKLFEVRLDIINDWMRSQGTTIWASTALSHSIMTQLVHLDNSIDYDFDNQYKYNLDDDAVKCVDEDNDELLDAFAKPSSK